MKRLKIRTYINKYSGLMVYTRKREEKVARKLYPTGNIIVMKFLIKREINMMRVGYIYKYRLRLNKFRKITKVSQKFGIKREVIDKTLKINKYRNKRKIMGFTNKGILWKN